MFSFPSIVIAACSFLGIFPLFDRLELSQVAVSEGIYQRRKWTFNASIDYYYFF